MARPISPSGGPRRVSGSFFAAKTLHSSGSRTVRTGTFRPQLISMRTVKRTPLYLDRRVQHGSFIGHRTARITSRLLVSAQMFPSPLTTTAMVDPTSRSSDHQSDNGGYDVQ